MTQVEIRPRQGTGDARIFRRRGTYVSAFSTNPVNTRSARSGLSLCSGATPKMKTLKELWRRILSSDASTYLHYANARNSRSFGSGGRERGNYGHPHQGGK